MPGSEAGRRPETVTGPAEAAEAAEESPPKRQRVEGGREVETYDMLKILESVGQNVLGRRIEVLWSMEDTETGQTTEHWWGCAVQDRTGASHLLEDDDLSDAEGGLLLPLVKLVYDAKPEAEAPTQEEGECCFVTDHLLYDAAADGLLAWRVEGAAWDPPRDAGDPERTFEENLLASSTAETLMTSTDSSGAILSCSAATVVDTMLEGVILRYQPAIAEMPRDRACSLADIIAIGRERLIEAIEAKWEEKKHRGGGPLSEQDMLEAIGTLDLDGIKAEAMNVSVTASCR